MMDNWQPIETAPKDGSRILLWFDGEPGHVDLLSWTGTSWSNGDTYENVFHGEVPTAWMPLPEPPVTA